jgi:hypothetical protein
VTYQPDLAKARLGAFAGLEGIRAVGWLSGDFEFSNGEVPDLLLERLGAYWRALHPGIDDPDRGILVPIAAAGRHACGLCLQGGVQPFQDSMEMYIADGDGGGFEAPSMIVHYIQTHRYRPPQPFVDAVLRTLRPKR